MTRNPLAETARSPRTKAARRGQSSQLALRAWLSVARAYNLCDAVMVQRLSALGLRLGEHEVLVNLMRTPGLTQQQLAQRCFVAKSGISMLVTRMEAAHWVVREADAVDARAWRLSLSATGLALAVQAQAIQTEVVAGMTGDSTTADLTLVAEAMERTAVTLAEMLQADGNRARPSR